MFIHELMESRGKGSSQLETSPNNARVRKVEVCAVYDTHNALLIEYVANRILNYFESGLLREGNDCIEFSGSSQGPV